MDIDIGGTKCAVITAHWDGENIKLLKKARCKTDLTLTPIQMTDKLIRLAEEIIGCRIVPAKLGEQIGDYAATGVVLL